MRILAFLEEPVQLRKHAWPGAALVALEGSGVVVGAQHLQAQAIVVPLHGPVEVKGRFTAEAQKVQERAVVPGAEYL